MEIYIGKSRDNDYKIEDPHVSRKHCKIIIQSGRMYIIDLNSTNGTYVDGEKIDPNEKYYVESRSEILLAGTKKLDWNILSRYIPDEDKTVRISEPVQFPQKSHELPGEQHSHKQELGNQDNERHEPRDRPNNDYRHDSPHRGLGSELAYAAHANKSYVGGAFVTLLLYWFGFWIGGFIANILYLNQAKRTKEIIGSNPPGRGCLLFLIWIHLFVPIILLILILTGSSLLVGILDY